MIGAKTKKKFSGKYFKGEIIGFDPKAKFYKVKQGFLFGVFQQKVDTWVSTDCVTAIDPESSVLMGQDGAMGRLSHSFVVQKGQ